MKRIKSNLFAAALALMASAQLALVSCSDDPGVENYYTSSKEYASDYLQNRSQYSEFVEVLQRATGEKDALRLVDMLGTYGSYTVFAPTNDAINMFLASKGVGSVSELSKEDCDTIALNSIIEQAFFTTDVSNDTYSKTNMLDQFLTITTDTITGVMAINSTSQLTHVDDSVANGVVHTVNKVVLSNTDLLYDFLLLDDQAKIYTLALELTHINDSLAKYIDETYSVGSDSIDWTNDALVMPTATEYDNVAYMEHRYFKYTMFICSDEVLAEKYGVTDIDGLRALAKSLYDPMYPEDADVTDETDRRNSLNRFISYHILPFSASFYQLTCVDGGNCTLANNWDRNQIDIADWYETMMPYSIMKLSFPNGSQEGLYINRRGVQARPDKRGVFVRGAKVSDPTSMGRTNTCLNGIYFYIDDVASYGKETQEVVLDERIRCDASTLSPDFITSGARGHYTRTTYESGKYGTHDTKTDHTNTATCLGFKAGSAKNFTYNNNTHLHVRPRVLSFWSYQGDEVTILGTFDFEVKLPPVPKGTYELRLFTCVKFPNRGIVQAYIDGVPQGIPYDMRSDGSALFGWKSDASLGDDDAIAAFDKSIHNMGWMKGPTYWNAASEQGGGKNSNFRDLNQTIRRVLGTFVSDGKTDHYVRFQQKLESTTNAMNFDFIEMCPSSIYNNEYYAEDKL